MIKFNHDGPISEKEAEDIAIFIDKYTTILLLKTHMPTLKNSIDYCKNKKDMWATFQKLKAFSNFIEHLKFVDLAEKKQLKDAAQRKY